MRYVPVVDRDQNPLMPTTANRAASWIKSGKATPFWNHGIFCVRLHVEPSERKTQEIAVGIDPGSKKEAFTVKSEVHTYLNMQTDAVQHVKQAMELRRQLRRARRFRKTPCRKNRKNRARGGLPPSTKARWQWKLRVCRRLAKLYPSTRFVVEDIKARTIRSRKKWNVSFSPLECGKLWFYEQLGKQASVETKHGWETKELRDGLGLKKSSNKAAEQFEAHCVDSWVLANFWVRGHTEPDNQEMLFVSPLRFHRRQLHRLEPAKGGVRSPYGGTRSLGLKRGSLVKHPKWGLAYVGGTRGERIGLHSVETGKRLCQNAKPADCRFLCFNSARVRLGKRSAASSSLLKEEVSAARVSMNATYPQRPESETERTDAYREELVERIARAVPEDGRVEPLEGLHLNRSSTPTDPLHGVSEPSFCVIAQGSKEVLLGDSRYRYDAAHYLLATIELPVVTRVIEASAERPYLSLRLELDPALVGSVMVEAGHLSLRNGGDVRAMDVSPLDAELLDAAVRLVRLLDKPGEVRVLRPLITREIVYRLLMGEQGNRLRRLALLGGQTEGIAEAIERLRRDFNQPLRIDSLARELGMSVSGFHHHFKAVTAMSPLQFQKQLRLQEARRILLGENLDAASAGYRVGYDDASQFSREYKRLFGQPPMRDMERLREAARR